MKNNKIKIIFISLFMALLVAPSIIWGSIKLFGGEKAIASISVELDEKRDLAEFPKGFDAKKITGELEAFYNDHVPFRSNIISFKNRFMSSLEKAYTDKVQPLLIKIFYPNSEGALGGGDIEVPERYEVLAEGDKDCKHLLAPREMIAEASCSSDGSYVDTCVICGYKIKGYIPKAHKPKAVKTVEASYETFGYTLYECSVCHEQFKGNYKEKLIDTSYKPPRIFGETVIEGRYGWLFYTGNNSVGYYRNINKLSEETMKEWVAVLEELNSICNEKGIELEVIVYPNKEQAYSEYMPTYEIIEGKKRTQVLAEYVSLNSSVNFTYAIEDLTKNKLYYETYYKYDTHWNDVGAFLGAQAIYKDLGLPTTDLLSLKIDEASYNFGDLLVLGNLSSAVYNTDIKYTVHYRDEVNYSASGEFDTGTVRTVSENGNGKKIVLIGDSFRNAMIKYLAKDFSEGAFTHRSKVYEVAADVKNTDVLVIEAVERYDYETINTAKTLINILKNS